MGYTTKYQSVVIIGKVTCGKGTQASAILDNFGGTMFSIGNKVREQAATDSTLGHKVKEAYEEGLLMPNWLASYWMMHGLLSQHVDDRLIFEAVARKPDEAEIFHEIHDWMERPYIVFHLDIPDEVVRKRSAGRRRDVVDAEEAVNKRLNEFNKYTIHSLEVFRKHGKLIDIDGTQSIQAVTEEIFNHLKTN